MLFNIKPNKAMQAALILFLLFCVSTRFMVTGLNARFTTRDSAGDSSRVAVFNISETSPDLTSELHFDMAPGKHIKEIEVHNDSEVVVRYTLTVANHTGNLPLQFGIYDNSTSAEYGPFYSNNFEAAMTELGIGETDTYYVTIYFPEENSLNYIGKFDNVSINVHAEQVD